MSNFPRALGLPRLPLAADDNTHEEDPRDEEHTWEAVVDAEGHPSQLRCSCGWVGSVLRP